MDYQYTSYSGSHPASTCYREDPYQKMASPSDDYMPLDFDAGISHQTHPNTHFPHWDPDLFGNNAPFSTRQVQEVVHPTQVAYMERIPPYPRPYDSPQSQSQSTCSEMLSPAMEFAHSPQDTGLSPHPGLHYDNYHLLLSEDHPMAGSGPTTVSPSLVNPEIVQQEQMDFDSNFDLIQRTQSFSSMGTNHELDAPISHAAQGHVNNRLSPEDMPVQQEILVAQSSYPEPSRAKSYSDVMDDDTASAHDDDPEYTPTPKLRTATSRRPATSNRGQKRRSDASRPSGRVSKHKRAISSTRNHAPTPTTPTQGFSCTSCQHEFHDDASLQKHMKTMHSRPFTCVFGFAGCASTFASKNEWKRHVLSQHVLLYYWICTEPTCAEAYKETRGAIFNRKDLYTQHVRRMHVPTAFRKALKTRKSVPEWDEQLRHMQEGALRHRCQLPTLLLCPASVCNMEFNGTNAWDDRMEHVARHLEKAALGEEPEVQFGGATDPTLNNWAASPQVSIIRQVGGEDRWELAQPLKTTSQGNSTARNSREQHSDSEDGHWEAE